MDFPDDACLRIQAERDDDDCYASFGPVCNNYRGPIIDVGSDLIITSGHVDEECKEMRKA